MARKKKTAEAAPADAPETVTVTVVHGFVGPDAPEGAKPGDTLTLTKERADHLGSLVTR